MLKFTLNIIGNAWIRCAFIWEHKCCVHYIVATLRSVKEKKHTGYLVLTTAVLITAQEKTSGLWVWQPNPISPSSSKVCCSLVSILWSENSERSVDPPAPVLPNWSMLYVDLWIVCIQENITMATVPTLLLLSVVYRCGKQNSAATGGSSVFLPSTCECSMSVSNIRPAKHKHVIFVCNVTQLEAEPDGEWVAPDQNVFQAEISY